MAVPNPCAVMQALVDWEMNAIKLLNKKFAALQRLAELIEQLGDVSTLLPNLSALIPVADIDLDVYTSLQVSCPFLNLPPYSNENLAALRSRVNTEYGLLARRLANHPYARLDKVQGMLNDWQNKINYPYGEDYLRCLNSICAAIGVAGSFVEGLSQVNVANELALFEQNFVQNAGQVLTEPMRIKRDEAFGAYNQVLDLRDETVQDFQTISTTGEVVPTKPPLRLGTPTGVNYTFDASELVQTGFPPSFPTSLANPPGGVGSVIPRT